MTNCTSHRTFTSAVLLTGSSLLIRAFLLATIALVTSSLCLCQDDRALALRQNVVRVTAGDGNGQVGFGFIVGEDSGFLYVVTANHVVAGNNSPDAPAPAIHVVVYSDQGTEIAAEILEHQVDHDLALLRFQEPAGFQWTRQCLAAASEEARHTRVWFIGRDANWYVPAMSGEISSNGLDADQWLQADISDLRPGSSGGPLVTSTGIIGMVEAKAANDTKILSIEFIEAAVKGWGYPWQLEAGSTPVQGNWSGNLVIQTLPTVLHLNPGGNGTIDSPSQNMLGVPLQYSTQGNSFSVLVPTLSASYVGTFTGSSMTGTFGQNGGHVPLELTRSTAPGVAMSLQGDWQGTLTVSISILFHFNANGGGTSDSPQQASFNIPAQYALNGNAITVTIPSLNVTYTATVNGNKMSGTFSQNSKDLPLEMTRQ